jgi:hypothetical protein
MADYGDEDPDDYYSMDNLHLERPPDDTHVTPARQRKTKKKLFSLTDAALLELELALKSDKESMRFNAAKTILEFSQKMIKQEQDKSLEQRRMRIVEKAAAKEKETKGKRVVSDNTKPVISLTSVTK